MISGIKLRDLRNAEYLQFMKNVVTLVSSNDPSALNIQSQLTGLDAQATDLETLFKLNQANELSAEIAALDRRRDNAITGLGLVVKGYLSHYNQALEQAAQRLEANLNLYGNDIGRQNLQAETALINGIVKDWETKPELNAAMTELGLKNWKDELKAANVLFDELYLTRTQQYGAASDETISSEKNETNQLYYALRDRIAALQTIQPTEPLQKTINELNALIEQYNRVLRNREPLTENENPAP